MEKPGIHISNHYYCISDTSYLLDKHNLTKPTSFGNNATSCLFGLHDEASSSEWQPTAYELINTVWVWHPMRDKKNANGRVSEHWGNQWSYHLQSCFKTSEGTNKTLFITSSDNIVFFAKMKRVLLFFFYQLKLNKWADLLHRQTD